MYTFDDKKNYYDEYEEKEVQEESFWQRNKSIIIKIIIIIICIIILILLIKALKRSNNVVYDNNKHQENITEVRMAAEDYFFLKNNLNKNLEVNEVTVEKLQKNGLIDKIVDANNRVCNENKSIVTVSKDNNLYAMRIKLDCSTSDKEEVFYYSIDNNACLNCDGKTHMKGDTTIKEDEKNTENNNNDENTIDYSKYSCKTWSEWTSERISDSLLEEKSRTLVKGVKKGDVVQNIEYGEWSNWTESPISENSDIEIDVLVSNEKRWSSNKTSSQKMTESDTIKIVSTEKVSGQTTSTCPKGYKKSGNKCVSNEVYTGDLTYKQYNTSSEYQVENKPCEAVDTVKDENGKYIWVYRNCQYRKITTTRKSTSSGYTVYTYQELETVPVTYYRSRTKKIVETKLDDVYTDKYYEENQLPSGYTKVPGSEIKEYSYKIAVCEK